MKKSLLILAMVVAAVFAEGNKGSAGDVVVTSGDNLLSVGFDVNNFSDFTPGVQVAWDHGVSFASSFTFGAQTGIYFWDGFVSMTPAFRAGWHPFAMPALSGKVKVAPVLDPYITMSLGTDLWFGHGSGDVFNGIYWDAALGINWMFADKVGLWGEIGRGFILGVTFKL